MINSTRQIEVLFLLKKGAQFSNFMSDG